MIFIKNNLSFLVHILTASGVICSYMCITNILKREIELCFFWLGIALIIDVIDGPIARKLDVKNKYPDTWNSPYSSLIKMVPTKTIFFSNDWNKSNITFKKYFEVIGVIIMADGDNTNSKFETQLKSISLELKY